ncbi:MAG: PAS domain-containing protein, partial [Desulfobacteraceae bacterium]|nr:PAS domain-containing protein [Desulfobacteraceae bacterium]
ENKFNTRDEKAILKKVHHDLTQIGIIFGKLSAGFHEGFKNDQKKNTASQKLEDRMIGALLIRLQTIISSAFQLQQLILKDVENIQHILIFLSIVTLLMFSFLVAGILFWINNSISKPIAKLEKGLRIIGSGNLQHKIGIVSKDEIGQFSKAFDAMTKNLRKTTVSKNYVDNIIASMLESLILVTPQGTIQMVNQATCNLLGYRKKDLIGQPITMILSKKLINELNKMGSQSDSIKELETVYLSKNKNRVPVLFSGAVMRDEENKIQGIICVGMDITMHKTIQDQLVRSENLAQTGKLAAFIAHDINSPLQGISSLLNVMKNTNQTDSKLPECIDLITSGVEQIKDTVARLLDLNRSEKGKKQLTDVNGLIHDIAKLFEGLLKKNKIELDLNLSLELNAIMASPQQLTQVFINLINNSVEAMIMDYSQNNDDGQQLPKEKKIIIRTENKKDCIVIELSDTGPGIDPKDIKFIFDPFYTQKKKMGLGIGLSICSGFISDLNGSITAKSLPGSGAVFTIIFPVN